MQAWNVVKVNDPDSAYHERAGVVVEVSHVDGHPACVVQLDDTADAKGERVQFRDVDLQVLA